MYFFESLIMMLEFDWGVQQYRITPVAFIFDTVVLRHCCTAATSLPNNNSQTTLPLGIILMTGHSAEFYKCRKGPRAEMLANVEING